MKLSYAEFDKVYQSSVGEIWPHWNEEMQVEIARHCVAWGPGRTDFLKYLRLSSVRFYKAYCALIETQGTSVCDVGGFWGVWPVTAKKLGFDVAMTEALKFYGESFKPLFEHIRQSGVEIFDHDPFEPGSKLSRQFDLVTVMAVLEHYPHSLKVFIENVKQMAAANGRIYIEVPNIAYLPKRVGLLRGDSPLARIDDIYQSETPFIGHHHEFTIKDMRGLARLSGLKIVTEEFYNYSLAGTEKKGFKLIMLYPAASLAFKFAKTCRECIAVVCEIAK